jgi:hypothetical protein
MSKYVITKVIVTRSTIGDPFKPDWPEMPGGGYKQYMKETYINTGKILSTSDSVSEDSLTLTSTSVWKSDEERLIYMADPTAIRFLEFLTDYRKSKNMVTEWVNKEYDGNTVIREWSGTW